MARKGFVAITLIASGLLATRVQAQSIAPESVVRITEGNVEPLPKAPPMDLNFTFGQGAALYNSEGAPSGVTLNLSALYRWGIFGIGASTGADLAILAAPRASYFAALAGLSYRFDDGNHIDALGVLGRHSYSGWGGSVWVTESNFHGASADLLFSGLLLRFLHTCSPDRVLHFIYGAEVEFDSDWRHQNGLNVPDMGGPPRMETVGGTRASASFVLGFVLDLGLSRRRANTKRQL